MRPLSADRILNRLSRELVGRFRMPPAACGYRFLNGDAPLSHDYRLIHPPTVSHVPLPCNVASRDDLSREKGRWGFSFFDVPERRVRETFVATVPNCRILSVPDQWGDRHYAILTRGERVLQVRGTGYERGLHAGLLTHRSEPVQRIRKGTWILELWDQNYSHWLQWHLVKVVLLQELGCSDDIIVPANHRLAAVVESSLEALGLRTESLPRLQTAMLDVDELTVVGIDDYRASLLDGLRDRFPRRSGAPPRRKLFISREKAAWRRLTNNEQCWEILRSRGYERVIMEDHDFRQQVALISDAAVVFALHGTGMANMIFAAPGLHVIEISDVSFPNPQFYALAGALGHHYWLLNGRPEGELRPGYRDVSVDPADVKEIVEKVEASLSTGQR